MSDAYYSKKLSANKLKRCYDIASPRIQQYLDAEIKYVQSFLKQEHIVLELGCGYGRILKQIAGFSKEIYGIDTSKESLELASEYLKKFNNIKLMEMNVGNLEFAEGKFDLVFAIQNGISAFKIDPIKLVNECLKVTKKGGKILFSSYSERIWDARLEWFKQQAEEGLLGEIDMEKTGEGTIVCKDGFVATTYSRSEFLDLSQKIKRKSYIEEIDKSSIFWVITV